MNVIFTVADLRPESGGPTRSVAALASALADCGARVEVVAVNWDCSPAVPCIPPKPVQTTLVPCRSEFQRRLKWSPLFASTLRKSCRGDGKTILHDNGIWLPTNHAAARVARQTGVHFIVSTRGMLTEWAFRYRGGKKRLAWWLSQGRDLQSARVLHATSQAEAEKLRALRLTQPIAVVPNGVTLPPMPRRTDAPAHRRTILFLGRIHPIKGLLNLVEAWAEVKPEGWRVLIAGGDEGRHLEEVRAACRKQKIERDIEFVGPVDGPAKWGLYGSADLFVLPSKSESFGIVITEALACGLPVVTTRGTPWEELAIHRCGWWIEIGVEPMARALREAIALSDAERHEMGRRGRKLVEEHYTWPAAAQKMVAVYRWMLGEGEKPGCVAS